MWLKESRNLCELPGREGLTKLPLSEIVQRFIIFLAEPWNSPAAMITKILFNQTSKVQMVRTGFLIKIHIRLLERFKWTISDKLHLIFSCEQRTNIWIKINQYDISVCWESLLGSRIFRTRYRYRLLTRKFANCQDKMRDLSRPISWAGSADLFMS